MKISQRIRSAYLPYRNSVFDIIRFQIVSGLTISILVFILRQLANLLIRSTGRVAVSTGDFDFIFKTWQGPLLIVLGITTLFIYVAADLNTQIIYASKLLNGKPDLLSSMKEGILSIRKFLTIDGLGIVLYISLIAPIVGLGISISLTRNLYIPYFISSVIHSRIDYTILYYLFILVFAFLGIVNIFTLHGILLSDLKSSKADDESRILMRKNWKDYLKQNLFFGLFVIGANFFVILFAGILPVIIAFFFFYGKPYADTVFIFVMLGAGFFLAYLNAFNRSFYLIRITQLYYRYKGEEKNLIIRKRKYSRLFAATALTALIVFLALLSRFLDTHFEDLFNRQITVGIIAHRAGGIEAPENTVKGLQKAIELEADGAEIDIQRSSDGYYIVNHDSTFSRLCLNSAKPSELTLEQIKALTLTDPLFPDDPQPVATFEEMLETAKDEILLFVELKGETADTEMVDDVVKMILLRGMSDNVVLISLKYNLIDYCENRYPEIQCAYLTFASFGNTAELNCDYLGLEEEAASSSNIFAIHKSGRKVLVWTPNTSDSLETFLLSDADYIITDRIIQAKEKIEELSNRNKFDIIMYKVMRILFY